MYPTLLPKRHFHALDISRLLAAVGVLFWHYQHLLIPTGGSPGREWINAHSPWFSALQPLYLHGWLAVQYFWCVSGFVFAHVYLADARAGQRFWPARIARLWPLHLITLGLVALLQAAYWHSHGTTFIYQANDAWHFALNLPMATSWGLTPEYSFNGPAWSLSAEILAYAVFWIALPLIRRFGLLLTAPVAAVAAWVVVGHVQDYPITSCIAWFFTGCTVYFAARRHWDDARWLAALAGLVVLASAWGWTINLMPLAEPTLVLGLFLFSLLADRLDIGNWLAALRRLGDASYGVYLWHFPLQIVIVLTLDRLVGSREIVARPEALLAFIAASVAAGFLSYRFVERPLQRRVLAGLARLGEAWRMRAAPVAAA